MALLLGGGLAFSAHGTKATARAAVNLSPEPFSNVAVSLIEDVIAIISIVLAFLLPIVMIILVTGFVVLSFFLLPKIFRLVRGGFRRVNRAT